MIFPPPSDEPLLPREPSPELHNDLPPDLPPLSPLRVQAAKRQARRWFLILLAIGLILGGLMAVGVVQVLNRLGLTAKPDQPFRIEQPQK